MIKDITKIQYIDVINVFPTIDTLKYHLTLKKGYVFNLTNTNSIITYNIEDLNKVIDFGIIWRGNKG